MLLRNWNTVDGDAPDQLVARFWGAKRRVSRLTFRHSDYAGNGSLSNERKNVAKIHDRLLRLRPRPLTSTRE